MWSPVGPDQGVPALAGLIADAGRILVFTGAGISTASGIPDYRGPQGVWKSSSPIYYQDFMSDHDARVASWERQLAGAPVLEAAQPNETHRAVAELERAGKIEMVVTQNIDGLHRDAGTSEEKLVEIHGTARLIECQSCRERTEPGPHREHFAETGEPPLCHCGGILKSATISFGQQLNEIEVARAFDAARRADLAVALGSTLSVTPAADIPVEAARTGARYAIVNKGETEHDRWGMVALRVEGDVTEVFPAAVQQALG